MSCPTCVCFVESAIERGQALFINGWAGLKLSAQKEIITGGKESKKGRAYFQDSAIHCHRYCYAVRYSSVYDSVNLLSISLPLEIKLSGKSKFILNLNNYRNLHYRNIAKAKKLYTENLLNEIGKHGVIKEYPLTAEYTYYAKSARRIDIANPLSIIDKFTQDAIVKAGILQDDNSEIIDTVIFKSGGIDRANPRAELIIYKTK